MKKYRVNVNGNTYEVEIELIDANDKKESFDPSEKKTSIDNTKQSSDNNTSKICSPMPGTILSVNVSSGQSVKKGDVLFILEAMKMENEIMASSDGIIESVDVVKGATVESGALLCTIK